MKRPPTSRGFTLLEIILALAILAAGLAMLGEAVRSGGHNAVAARELSRAQLLAASKLAEITAGAVEPEPVQNAIVAEDLDWRYGVELNPTDVEGLVELRVTVGRPVEAGRRAIGFTLVQWIPDPGYDLTESDEATSEPDSASAAGGDGG